MATMLRFFKKNKLFQGFLFVVIVATVAHLLFSSFGFNPTDDGFILAGSRRILDGEIPHRDFISVRTAGSLYLHAPLVLLFEDNCLWWSRYAYWVEMATVAWIWTLLVERLVFGLERAWYRFGLGTLAFCFSCHVFPAMVWHTIDAIFFSSIGLFLATQMRGPWKMIGYLFIGFSVVFRQNFVVLLPISIIVLEDFRKIKYWIMLFLPITCYVVFLVFNHALSDFIIQMTAYSSKTSAVTGIYAYVISGGVGWGAIIGFVSMMMLRGEFRLFSVLKEEEYAKVMGLVVLFGAPIGTMVILAYAGFFYIGYPSFFLFGLCLGVSLNWLHRDRGFTTRTRIGVLVLALPWTASLSVGYNTPALGAGFLVIYVIASVMSVVKIGSCRYVTQVPGTGGVNHTPAIEHKSFSRVAASVLISLLLISVPSLFGAARMLHIYREAPAGELSYELGAVLDGGRGIRTDRSTYAFLMDLRNATELVVAEGKEYVIVPDCAAFWIRSDQRNPIPCDWPQDTELGNQKLRERVQKNLEDDRGRVIILVQKYEANSLHKGLTPLADRYSVVQYIRSNFVKLGETPYFELYG